MEEGQSVAAAVRSIKLEQDADTAPAPAPAAEAGNAEFPLLKSVANCRFLSSVLSIFIQRFDELQLHLDSIKKSIEQRSKELDAEDCISAEAPLPQNRQNPSLNKLRSHLEFICHNMQAKALRKYVVKNLSNIKGLREEVPEMLKRLAPEPGRLVLDSLARFYLQGSKAFASKDSILVRLRRASISILEFFLLSGCETLEPPVKAEAEVAAAAWKNRIIREGGIASANYEDALGFLLLIAAFGVASGFEIDDLSELVRVSRVQQKANVLCRSKLFVDLIKDVIEGMVKKGMHVAAVGLVCNFGLKDKFPPHSLLSSFLSDTDETAKKMRKEGQASQVAQKEACRKKLVSLKSVVKCVKDYKLNIEELSSWKINENIASLEKEISSFALNKKDGAVQKRKAKEVGSSEKRNVEEAKRHQPNSVQTSFPGMPSANGPSHWQKLYDGQLPPQILLNSGSAGLSNTYSHASVETAAALSGGSSMSLLTANVPGALERTGGGLIAGAWPLVGMGVGPSTGVGMGAYAGIATGLPIGRSGEPLTECVVRSYGLQREAFSGYSGGQNLLGTSSPSAVGKIFPGLPASATPVFSGSSYRGPASNLYQFADLVLEGESYHGSSRMESGTSGLAPALSSAPAPVQSSLSHHRSFR